ncbi:MAG TPA: nuclear transport factor 2 family protein [Pyrinomonadaceae bacterium]
MKKILLVLLTCGVLFTAISVARSGRSLAKTSGNETTLTDDQRVANLLRDMNNVDLAKLQALPAERFALPAAGVDVMRVRLEETYDIKGVGKDTVELTGWIAAKHDNARPASGETEVKWGTAIVDTEFVGLELRGNSKVFGPVLIHLNKNDRSLGQVGKLDLPFVEQIVLDAAYRDLRPLSPSSTAAPEEAAPVVPQKEERGSARDQRAIRAVMQGVWKAIGNRDAKGLLQYYSSNSKTAKGGEEEVAKQFSSVRRIKVSANNDLRIRFLGSYANVTATGMNTVTDREGKSGSSTWKADVQLEKEGDRWVITQDRTTITAGRAAIKVPDKAGKCLAKISVDVEMPNLNITMRSKEPVKWYSEVETIPPIGYTASVSTSSTAMMSGDREVASLLHGAIKFREIVQRIRLDGTNWQLAANRK